jgi:capsular polysaccharide biosynthesis protein
MGTVPKSYGWLHSTLVAGVRRLPISSKTFGPPKGIIPDIRRWVDDYQTAHPEADCWYRKIHDAVEVQHQPARSIEEFAPVFLEEEKVQQPEVFAASIPQPRILSQTGIIIAPDDQVFEQSCCWKSHFLTRDIEYNSLRRKLNPQKLPGSYITLLSRHSASFYHWFTECLLRLYVVESLPALPILIQDDLRDWQRESLAQLGINGERLVQLPAGCYEVDQLYFPSFPGYATFTKDWTFSWADWTLVWLHEKFCGRRKVDPGKRIYVSREGAAHRRVVNEPEVMRRLEQEGFLIVNANPLSNAEKIELFGDASLIVSAHGAGLTHLLFAPEGAKVVEALDPFHLAGGLYYQMAASLGHEYWYLFAENQAWKSRTPRDDYQKNRIWPFDGEAKDEPGPRKSYDDLTVPIDLLLRTIEAAMTSA